MSQSVKKLATILTTSLSMTIASMETNSIIVFIFKKLIANTKVPTPAAKAVPPLEYISCIHYLLRFQKNQTKI